MSATIAGDAIQNYYALSDAQDIDALLSLFAEDAVYDRAGARYVGLGAISAFFREERKIHGKHTIETIYSLGSHVIALGIFEGVGEAGDPRRVGFADFWEFDEIDRVRRRRTFLATGHEIVRR